MSFWCTVYFLGDFFRVRAPPHSRFLPRATFPVIQIFSLQNVGRRRRVFFRSLQLGGRQWHQRHVELAEWLELGTFQGGTGGAMLSGGMISGAGDEFSKDMD